MDLLMSGQTWADLADLRFQVGRRSARGMRAMMYQSPVACQWRAIHMSQGELTALRAESLACSSV